MSKHTPEPWGNSKLRLCFIEFEKLGITAIIPQYADEEAKANTRRIVTCVNACAGMDDPAAEIEKLRRQRDELLGLVRAVVCHSTVKDVMGVKCAAFPWTEYEGLAAKVKEIADES